MTLQKFKFNRSEFAGSLGDLGTLLPLAIGMIMVNGLAPLGVFLGVGLFYILSALYFKTVMPVQPMKVIGAYAIATAMSAPQIMASGLLMALFLFLVAVTGTMTLVGKYTPKSVIRGVQLSTGILLMLQGIKYILGNSKIQSMHQAAEPYLSIQALGPLPFGLIIGILAIFLTLFLLDSKKVPAALAVIFFGLIIGLVFGNNQLFSSLQLQIHLPEIMPFDFPSQADFTFALFALALPQLPMTLGNAVIANADLSHKYFDQAAYKVTNKSLCLSISLANICSFFLGGMPMCHGAGGLAAHYRFGARTAGSNLIIGTVFICLALFLGKQALLVVQLIPLALLGVLLLFAGSQLAMTLADLDQPKDLFVTMLMLGITLASNLAVAFISCFFLAHALKWRKLNI